MLTDPSHFLIAEDFQSPFDTAVVHLLIRAERLWPLAQRLSERLTVTNLAWSNYLSSALLHTWPLIHQVV